MVFYIFLLAMLIESTGAIFSSRPWGVNKKRPMNRDVIKGSISLDMGVNRTACNTGYYLASSGKCEACDEGCDQCTGTAACTKCSSFYDDSDGDGICWWAGQCEEYCEACTEDTISHGGVACTKCSAGRYITGSTCSETAGEVKIIDRERHSNPSGNYSGNYSNYAPTGSDADDTYWIIVVIVVVACAVLFAALLVVWFRCEIPAEEEFRQQEEVRSVQSLNPTQMVSDDDVDHYIGMFQRPSSVPASAS